MKTVALLIILGLCTTAFAATVASTSQSGAISSSLLNSTATKVYSASNNTDATVWNSYAATTPGTTGIPSGNVIFGPGPTNETAYVYGFTTTGTTTAIQINAIVKRTVNATIVGWGNDTADLNWKAQDSISSLTIPAADSAYTFAVAPGYLAILSRGPANGGTQNNVYLTIVSGTSATPVAVTTATDSSTGGACKGYDYIIGNVWYDIGTGAFFYTYSQIAKSDTANPCVANTFATTAYNVFLGGHYVNGTAFWTVPGLSVAASTPNLPASIMGGGDNWLASANIYIVYKDTVATTTYYSKTALSANTSAVGAFQSLVADVPAAAQVASLTYTPLSVWASDYTYGIAVACANQTTAAGTVYTYPIWNFINGTMTTKVDSGLSYAGVTDNSGGATRLSGWMLTTGYTLVGEWTTATTPSYQFGTFYANGTANTTATTLGTLQGPLNFFEDANGTMWVGWTDVDTGNALTYAGYLAKLQGQLNASGANALSTILAFVALFLASIFAF